MKTPPKFNWRRVSQWRAVDLSLTMKIAHRCTSGVHFTGCSKAGIIEAVAMPNGFTSDAPKFIAMMDEAAKFIPMMKEKFASEVNSRLEAFELRVKTTPPTPCE